MKENFLVRIKNAVCRSLENMEWVTIYETFTHYDRSRGVVVDTPRLPLRKVPKGTPIAEDIAWDGGTATFSRLEHGERPRDSTYLFAMRQLPDGTMQVREALDWGKILYKPKRGEILVKIKQVISRF